MGDRGGNFMKNHWKPWMLALSSAIVALFAVVWRMYDPLERAYTRYLSEKVEEAVSLLESDTAVYYKETQDAVRVVAAAAATGIVISPEATYVLALQYEREGDLAAAEEVLRQTIEKADAWSWPYVALGTLLARAGDDRLDEAEQLLRKAIALQPDWVRPYNSLGVVLRMLTRFEEAEAVALQALALAPDDVAVHNNYANLLVVLKRFEEAEAHYTIAMEREPENAKPPYNLACLYSIIGLYEDACDFLELAISLSASSITDAAIDPYFDPMRAYPRFQRLLYGVEIVPEGEIVQDPDAVTATEVPSEGEAPAGSLK